ncbi:hypothetical protein K239x_17520 [Planctomycetes bacterium K23_9]|uniref:Uncharacterized protein n=1 Tax=Stieleria marina TaxID=1930275 RepID=A0A517NRQ4_9BACT|nr:hypothetical protein K239x_17520 [Planctomycetes bacterium K23_9]
MSAEYTSIHFQQEQESEIKNPPIYLRTPANLPRLLTYTPIKLPTLDHHPRQRWRQHRWS